MKMILLKKRIHTNNLILLTIFFSTCLFTAFIYPQNTVEITSGNTVELLNGNQMEISGSLTDAGTLTADNASTVIFNGTVNSAITKSGGENFTNLVVIQSSGTLTLNNNANVSGALSIISGSLITGTDTVTLGGSATITESSGSTVIGNLTTTRTLSQNVNNTFGGMGVEIKESALSSDQATVTRVTGIVLKDNGSSSIKRYFDIVASTNNGLNAIIVFHYDAGELNALVEPELQVFNSTDRGGTWTNMNGIVDASAHTVTINGVNSFSRLTLFDTNNLNQIVWENTNNLNDGSIPSLAVDAKNVLYAGTSSGDVYKSSDEGSTWTLASTISANNNISSLSFSPDSEFYAGVYKAGVYKSTDNGSNWTLINGSGSTQITDLRVDAVIALGNNVLLAGTYGGGIFKSTDDGSTWNQTSNTLSPFVYSFIKDMHNNLYAGTDASYTTDDAVLYSPDNGSSWAPTGLNGDVVKSLAFGLYNKLFAGCGNSEGLFSSSDSGKSWTSPVLSNNNILALTENKSGDLFAGTADSGVYESGDNGINWTQVNNNLTDLGILSFAVDNNGILFAGTDLQGVFKASQSVTAVKNNEPQLPAYYMLNQNYPNPFNPTTTINYSIPRTSFVTLKIYDVLGREIETLINEAKQPGKYSVRFNAENLTSGVYFYRIVAGNFSAVKKLILLK